GLGVGPLDEAAGQEDRVLDGHVLTEYEAAGLLHRAADLDEPLLHGLDLGGVHADAVERLQQEVRGPLPAQRLGEVEADDLGRAVVEATEEVGAAEEDG